MEVVRSAAGAEGLLEVVVATTARVATTQTQALKAMHQQGAGVMVLAEVGVVDTGVVVVDVAMEEAVKDANMSDMTLVAVGMNSDGSVCCDVQALVSLSIIIQTKDTN